MSAGAAPAVEPARVLRNVLIVGSGGALGQAVNALSQPLLSRLYSPGSFGEWALWLSAVLVPATVATLRLELAILLPATDEDAAPVLDLALAVSALAAAAAALVLPLLPEAALGLGSLRSWLWSVPCMVFLCGAYQACLAWCNRMREFKRFSFAVAVLPLATVLVQLLAALTGWSGASGLILGSLLGQAAASAALVALVIVRHRRLLRRAFAWPLLLAALGRYRSYPLYMTPCSLLSILRSRIAVVVLGSHGMTAEAGFYHFSEKVIRLPCQFVGDAIRPVFFQRAAELRLRELEPALLRGLQFVNELAMPFFVVFWFEAATLFAWIFGEPWRDASLYAVILSAPIFVLVHSNWLDRGLDVLGRQKLAFQLEAVFSVLSIGLLYCGVGFLGSLTWGIALHAGGFLVYNLVWLALFFRAAGYSLSGLGRLAAQAAWRGAAWASVYGLLRLVVPAAAPRVAIYGLVAAAVLASLVRRRWRQLGAGALSS